MKLKNLLLSAIILSSMMTACEKESDFVEPFTANDEIDLINSKVKFQKTITDLTAVGQAAEIDEINYDSGTDTYEVTFYDSTSITYDVTFNTVTNDMIELTINDGTNDYDAIFDASKDSVFIEGDTDYEFVDFENYVVSSSSNRKKNVAIIVSVVHLDSQLSVDFSDNGTGDEYDVGLRIKWGAKFWWNSEPTYGPCENGWRTSTITWERFGLFTGNFSTDVPC